MMKVYRLLDCVCQLEVLEETIGINYYKTFEKDAELRGGNSKELRTK